MTVYHPFEQEIGGGRLLCKPATQAWWLRWRIIRELTRPAIERARRSRTSAPKAGAHRLNDWCSAASPASRPADRRGRVAGVRAWSVTRAPRVRHRLAPIARPRRLMTGVLREGACCLGRDRRGAVAGALA